MAHMRPDFFEGALHQSSEATFGKLVVEAPETYMLVKMDHPSKFRGDSKGCLKPPSRCFREAFFQQVGSRPTPSIGDGQPL